MKASTSSPTSSPPSAMSMTDANLLNAEAFDPQCLPGGGEYVVVSDPVFTRGGIHLYARSD